MVTELDTGKSYNRLLWDFIRKRSHELGFSDTRTNWLM